jgi:hypothetical protein
MAAFEALAATKSGLGIDIIYRAPSPTNKFGGRSRPGPVALRPINSRSISHCAVPSKMLPTLMAELAAQSSAKTGVLSGADLQASPYWESEPNDREESEQHEMTLDERPYLEAGTSYLDYEDEGKTLESLPDEVAPANFESAAEFDPYAGIRSALSPEHAALAANEIPAVLGPRPAIVALYGLLAQPELTRALLAVLLGKTGRSSLPVNGADIPVTAYLQHLSRLFREVAEYDEAEFDREDPASSKTGPQRAAKVQVTSTAIPVLQLDRIQLAGISAPFIRNASGGFEAFFALSALPSPMASLTIAGRVMIDDAGKLRALRKSDKARPWLPVDAVNWVYTARGTGTSNSSSAISKVADDGTFTTESELTLDPGTQRIHILVKSNLKDGKEISADAVFQRNDLEVFLSIVDRHERARANTLTHLEFLSSVRKIFQPPPRSSLVAFFERLFYRNRTISRLVDIDTAEGRLIRRFENMEIGGLAVDIGHVLTGIEGSRKQQPQLGSPAIGPWHWHILGDDDVEATVTWGGDFGLALASYAEDMLTGKNVDIRTYLNAHGGFADLIGDIDGINIGARYDPSQSLAENLRAYYNAIPFRRFHSFLSSATDDVGKPLFTLLPGQSRLAPGGRQQFAHYVLLFAHRKLAFASNITPAQLASVMPMVQQGSTAKEISVITDYFFTFVEDGIARELSR